jgi:hypothetical protein
MRPYLKVDNPLLEQYFQCPWIFCVFTQSVHFVRGFVAMIYYISKRVGFPHELLHQNGKSSKLGFSWVA